MPKPKLTLFFYDLETTGFNPRAARVMQFAGQRTDLEVNPVDEPFNYLIKLTDDVLPDPDAILITGITPQMTRISGKTEAEFLKIFNSQIATPGTVFVGFNNIRFDDEFMRFLNYRNFYDAYEWHYKDDRGRWDLLDMVRMTRALRPEGLKWPVDADGVASNRLELLSKINHITHANIHDALSDVQAELALAKLIKTKQPKLFDFLLSLRDKQKVEQIVTSSEPFVYTSGKYPSEFEKTTVAATICLHPKKRGALVYDLRHDPQLFKDLTSEQLAKAWQTHPEESELKLPVKTLQFNRCPAVAPLGVIDTASQKRLQIDLAEVNKNFKALMAMKGWDEKLLKAVDLLNRRQQAELISDEQAVDARLYDDFFSGADKNLMAQVRTASPEELKSINPNFKDNRLSAMLSLYKARNYPKSLSRGEQKAWLSYKLSKLTNGGSQSQLALYQRKLAEIKKRPNLSDKQRHLAEELELWGQQIKTALQ